jgi:hypothetical protein
VGELIEITANEGDIMRAGPKPRPARNAGRLLALLLAVSVGMLAFLVGGAAQASVADGGSTPGADAVTISLIPATSSALPPAAATAKPTGARTQESVSISLIPATSTALPPSASPGRSHVAASGHPRTNATDASRSAGRSEELQAPTGSAREPVAGQAIASTSVWISLIPATSSAIDPAPSGPGATPGNATPRPAQSPSRSVAASDGPAGNGSAAIDGPKSSAPSTLASPSSSTTGAPPPTRPAAQGGPVGSASSTPRQAQGVLVPAASGGDAAAYDGASVTPTAVTSASGGWTSWLLVGAAVLVALGAVGIALTRLRGAHRQGSRTAPQ